MRAKLLLRYSSRFALCSPDRRAARTPKPARSISRSARRRSAGTAGLLYGDGDWDRSWNRDQWLQLRSSAVGNNIQLSLTTDGTSSNFAATLALINKSERRMGQPLEVYDNVGGTYSLNTYINSAGVYYSTLNMVISGHYSAGPGRAAITAADSPFCLPMPTIKTCMIAGPMSPRRATRRETTTDAAGALSFSGQNQRARSRLVSTPRTARSCLARRR